MALHEDAPRIAMQVSRGVVVASIQVDLHDDVLERFRGDLLQLIQQSGCRGVILDVSGLETLDAEEFAALKRVIHMACLMGADSILVGLRPGVVAALIETGADVDGVRAAINLDAGFALLEPREAPPEPDAGRADDAAGAEPAQEEAP